MLFNSISFLIFFPIVTLAYFALPHKARWPWLLAASCFFYMAFIPAYILILFFTILVDYAAGILIARTQGSRRRWLLIMSLVANIGVLAFFKYYNFASSNLDALARFIGWNYSLPALGIILPIGLSFHTFQSMSYTIEVYRGRQPAETHLGIFALYVMFYPQLVAGPIERPQNLLPQFHERKMFDYARATSGLKLMAWGFFKKIMVADALSVYVNAVYSDPHAHAGFPLIIATVLFAYQIYCDFSGYSDIARGSARVMGFELMVNFNRPYASASVAEFWTRWHCSLSTWFRDYLYIPLGGSRVGRVKTDRNLMITFVLSGLWHGANWTYVTWGFLNGCYLVALASIRGAKKRFFFRVPRGLAVIATLCLISVAWIFFRANSFSDAFYIVTHLFSGFSHWATQWSDHDFMKWNVYAGDSGRKFRVAVLSVVILEILQFLNSRWPLQRWLAARPPLLRWAVYVTAVMVIINSGTVSELPFIYFQF
jgi:D-alanyl-lipoteichoic acid acyltransferase DltB (MBOAT superfamily)